ncbi:MAG: heme-binding protein [Chloroflexi bacterium]|nr:heme-binding protein [Chloroflexota bacterium]
MQQFNSLGYAEAQLAIQTIQAEVTRRGKAVVIAVADPHGELIALARMDGAPLPSINIAMNKAFTAARKNEPTRDIGQRLRDPEKGFDIAYLGDPHYVGWGGGLPVRVNGELVGAVAVSGLPETEDMQVVALGVEAICKSLSK